MEVMGRYAGWIALHAAIAGGADICLIPEIPYRLSKVIEKIESRFINNRGFAIVVVAEGAAEIAGEMVAGKSSEVGYENPKLGGISIKLEHDLKSAGVTHDIRVTIPGHLQRGGRPYAYDRILATQFGVKAFEMVLKKEYGRMVAYRHPEMISVPIEEAISKYNLIDVDNSFMVRTARGLNISLGD
jgi:6-phosphofructokinase 1